MGNLAVGGTGKTPMAELIVKTLQEESEPDAEPVIRKEDMEYDGLFAGVGLFDGNFGDVKDATGKTARNVKKRNIGVLSRGYKRKSKGYQLVPAEGTAKQYGDEPLQIKRKFPNVSVAVDADRLRGVRNLQTMGVDYVILDDAYQHRRIKPTKTILLTSYNNPYFKDRLMPWGKLRDLPGRARKADMIVVTKCPTMLDEWEKSKMASNLGLKCFDNKSCTGVNVDGRTQYLLFATLLYEKLKPVFPEGDMRYIHSGMAILFTGIANDTPLVKWLCDSYKIINHFKFPDHHIFSKADIHSIVSCARHNPISVVITTEKDAQRMRDGSVVPDDVRKRMFYAPIRTMLLSTAEHEVFRNFLNNLTL